MFENLPIYILTSGLLILSPGLDTVFVLNTSVTRGRELGIVAAAGISVGILVHTLFACLGLSALVAASPKAFAVIKYVGAGYLFYLGVAAFFEKPRALGRSRAQDGERPRASSAAGFASKGGTENLDTSQALGARAGERSRIHLFAKAILTNVLNPKVAIFFVAFFPQFVKAGGGPVAIPFLILGSIYFVMTMAWLSLLAFFAAKFSARVNESPRIQVWINRIAGVAFILLALKLALARA